MLFLVFVLPPIVDRNTIKRSLNIIISIFASIIQIPHREEPRVMQAQRKIARVCVSCVCASRVCVALLLVCVSRVCVVHTN